MIDGVLYTQAGTTRNVVAIDPKSGELLWVWRPNDGEQRFARAPRKTSGRGPAYWTDGAGNERLFTVTPGFFLAALDPDTGRPVPGFGENGIVDLMVGVRGEVNDKSSIGNSSPPTIVGDVVIVGPAHEVGMRPPSKANLEGRRARLRRPYRQAAVDVPHDPRSAASRATRRGSTARPKYIGQRRRLGCR